MTATFDTTLNGLVENVLKDFTSANRIFTAFDVTKEVRNRAKSDFYVRHSEVRDIVHHAYQNENVPFENGSDYVQSNHYVGNSLAAIYHPIGVDLSTYHPDDIKVNKRFVGKKHLGRGLFVIPSTSNTTKKITQVSRGSRRRLIVPAEACRAIGLLPDRDAYLRNENGRLVISTAISNEYVLRVDKYTNLRISASILSSVCDEQDVFDIYVDEKKNELYLE